MKRVKFCFGIYNHQPVGNFGWVIEEAFQKSYLPFLVLLEKYPGIRISLHFTGILYDWMKEFHPEGLTLVKTLVKRGQVELLTGGYFEPILPVIPDRDKAGQIAMQSDFIKSEFGVAPTGMWLAERVWEPTLPKYIHQAGVKYTILDDIHFRYSGLQ
ncbi:MAG: 4-alpha-glucanotransferase, partial [Candidatus Zixiibacteriota bacterium]